MVCVGFSVIGSIFLQKILFRKEFLGVKHEPFGEFLYKRNVINGSLFEIMVVCKCDIYFCDVLILIIDDIKRKLEEWLNRDRWSCAFFGCSRFIV